MKAKFFMMVALSTAAVALGSCSDDPAKDFPESEFEIRQLRIEALNSNNGTEARSSENPVNASKSLPFATIDPQGNPYMVGEGEDASVYVTKVGVTLPTDAVIAYPGQDITISFLPGQQVTDAQITLPNGTTVTLTADNAETTEENESQMTYNVGDFEDGCTIKGLKVLNENGSIYNYTGELFIWHYHPMNFTVTNESTGAKASTLKYDAAKNAVVRTQALDDEGQPAFNDETGDPIFVQQSVLVASPGDKLTLAFEPAYPGDQLTATLPSGENVVLNANNKTASWTANEFGQSSTISASLVVVQPNRVEMISSTTFTINAPEAVAPTE